MTHYSKKAVILVLIIVLLPLWSCLADDGVFLRVDRDDPDAWKQDLANVRYLTDENMSGSTQFSVNQFRALVPELRKQAENLWIIDCRMESMDLKTESLFPGVMRRITPTQVKQQRK